jgi:cell division protein FtsQ
VGIGLAVALLVVAAGFGVMQLRHAETFAVRTVKVNGARRVTQAEVVRIAEVPRGATLFEANRTAIADRVERDPWIASAEVTRDFPHTLVIQVTERSPAAWVNVSKRASWLVSTDGTWLRPRAKTDTSTLPVVTDVEGLAPVVGTPVSSPEVTNMLAVLKGLSPELRALVKYGSAPSIEKTALVTKTGIQVFIGPASEMKKKDAVVRAILARQKERLVYINVRTPDRPTWRGLDQP